MEIKRISKNKATGTDNITLQPLDNLNASKLKINNETYEDYRDRQNYKVSKKDWRIMCF